MGLLMCCPCCPQEESNTEPLLKHGQSYSSIGSLGQVGPAGLVKGNGTDFQEQRARSTFGRIYGCPLATLDHDESQVPLFIDRMIQAIEKDGLWAEGLYRKCGLAVDVREFIKACNQDFDSVDVEDEHIHVLATAFKTFFRDLPEPLLSYSLYDEFLSAATKTDEERLRCIYAVRDKLPQQNIAVLDRLLDHLARVAINERENRMTCNSLAIIFAPNVLQPFKNPPPEDMLTNVQKQTMCIQCMLEDHLKKLDVQEASLMEQGSNRKKEQ